MLQLKNHDGLLAALELDASELRFLVENRDLHYKRRVVRRRTGRRVREVYEVVDGLRRVHRVVAMMLRDDVDALGDWVTGFRTHGSTVKHAEPHCKQPEVAVADIKSFFPSISEERVWRLFTKLGCSENVAMTLARLTTVQDALPEGARSSPAIANLVASELDSLIVSRLGKGVNYTRYADDLAFSGETVPSEETVASWMMEAGFVLKPASYKAWSLGQGPYVTGLYVGDESPKLSRKRRRMIERTLFYLEKPNKDRALEEMHSGPRWRRRSAEAMRESLRGQIIAVRATDRKLALAYEESFRQVFGPLEGP